MKLNLRTKVVNRLRLTLHPRYRPFQRPVRRVFIRPKTYLFRLLEKQRVRYHHALTHKQLRRYNSKVRRHRVPAGLALLCELAMRLDSILYQLGFADSIRSARQLIQHGHIFVNGYRVSVPGYRCRAGDVLSITPASKVRRLVNNYLLKNRMSLNFNHLLKNTISFASACVKNHKIFIHRDVKPRELMFKCNLLLMMEYFRKA